MAVGDPPGQFELVPKALDDALSRGDFGVRILRATTSWISESKAL
jgi:hypothetical protein